MTSATRLSPNTNANSKSESYKYKLTCQDKISDDSPSTKDWLELLKDFNHNSTDVKLFEALLEKQKHVVVKIGMKTNVATEYELGKIVSVLKLPTLMSFYCHFTCIDTFNTIEINKGLCGNKEHNKDSISVLVMPYIREGRVDNYPWTRHNIHVYKLILQHVVCTLLFAFETCILAIFS